MGCNISEEDPKFKCSHDENEGKFLCIDDVCSKGVALCEQCKILHLQ